MISKNLMSIYYVVSHKNVDEIISIIQLFYFGEKIARLEEISNSGITIKSYTENNNICCDIYKDGNKISSSSEIMKNLDENIFASEMSRLVKLTIFNSLQKIRKISMPWGILTGIRPTKKVNELLKLGYTHEELEDILKYKYFVEQNKINLLFDIAQIEEKIIEKNSSNKISIYIGIPFCPTRCVYCSFTSFNLNQYTKKVDLYLECLEKEINGAKEYINDFEIENIYVGGGTPTSLNEKQLNKLLEIISNSFKYPSLEYTIEAGRADTINKEKLKLLKQFKVNRISINPQTMNDKTLKIIGRNHMQEDFTNAFYMARDIGFENINTDVILGLTGENSSDVLYTMEKLFELNPDNLTVHTLSLKRASRLNEIINTFNPSSFYEMEKMINITGEYASKMNMYPYYMYRQKNTLGNFENVGYCKAGLESTYNIQIMEEKQTIISFGAGSTSKFYFDDKNLIERVFNLKSVDEYIRRIDEMIYRKLELLKKLKLYGGIYEKT